MEAVETIKCVFLALVSEAGAPRTSLGLPAKAGTAVSPRSCRGHDCGRASVIVVRRTRPVMWFLWRWKLCDGDNGDFWIVLVAIRGRLQCGSCAFRCEVVICGRNCPENYNGGGGKQKDNGGNLRIGPIIPRQATMKSTFRDVGLLRHMIIALSSCIDLYQLLRHFRIELSEN